MQTIKEILGIIRANKILSFIVVFSLIVIIGSGVFVLSTNKTPEPVTSPVLGAKTEKPTATPTPPSPTPTVVPTIKPKTVLSIKAPTPTPTPTSSPSNNSQNSSPTSTPTPNTNSNSNNSPTPTETPTPTPTPAGLSIEIKIDYAGQEENDTYNVTVEEGTHAWDAIKEAIGIENLQYTDYGGDMGIFITGFNGIAAAPNQFYEFKVNGASSSVGVSSYICNNGDKLEFVLTSF
jgi:hypothetical protein